VALTCAVTPTTAVPPTCSLSTATISGGTGTSTLMVSTVAGTASVNRAPAVYYAMLMPLLGLTLLGGSASRRKNFFSWLLLCLMLCGLIWMTACGGGSNSGGGGGAGTTAGTYTVTVTGTSGSIVQKATLSVTVQ
jgi:trimeric autotransporter adhesin